MVEVVVEVAGGAGPGDEARDLWEWLTADHELHGRVAVALSEPVPGTLGLVADTLTVALGPGGAATALAAAVVMWVRGRTGVVRVKVRRPAGEFEVTAEKVRGLDAAGVRAMTDSLARMLTRDSEGNSGEGNTGSP